CHRPLPAYAGQARAAADGMGCVRYAGGECRHPEGHPPGEMDLPEHRLHAGTAEAAWLRLRLVARAHDLQARVLPLGAVAVYETLRKGLGVPEELGGQLGPG